MNHKIFPIFLFLVPYCLFSQKNISQTLEKATKDLLENPQMISANLSFYVADENGNHIYQHQGNKGLSTASTQKIFTAIAALETLGTDFQYKTSLSITPNEDLILFSEGDPTLGSWRFEETQPEKLKQKLLHVLKSLGINSINGNLIIDDSHFDIQSTPGGWAWNDIGNYYGAGTWGVNWRENQFDVHISGGTKEGEITTIKSFSYPLVNVKWVNQSYSYKGDRDKSIIYTAPFCDIAYINGYLPANKTTTVSGAVPNPPLQLATEIVQWLKEHNIDFKGKIITASQEIINNKKLTLPKGEEIWVHHSPKMEKIIYWFMRKSVNLYGETLIKTMGKHHNKQASFENGIKFLKEFWTNKGIHPAMVNFMDGSGLSPQNYASAKAEVQALIWAKKQPWFPIFEEAMPTYNHMKMKSGTIKDTKAYAGYHTSKAGKKYVFSVIVNNYHGGNINSQLFRLLNVLK